MTEIRRQRLFIPFRLALLFLAVTFAAAGELRAQEHPIELRARMATPRSGRMAVRPGERLSFEVTARIPMGWHLYSLTQPPGGPIATTIDVGPSALARVDGIIGSPLPIIAADPNFGINSEWYEDSVAFHVPVRLASTAGAGARDVDVRVAYQTCNARYCLPPTEDTVRVALAVGAVSGKAARIALSDSGRATLNDSGRVILSEAKDRSPSTARPIIAASIVAPLNLRAGSRSFVLFLWLAATMGALSLLTPCVFPMVPITISYFSRRDRGSRTAAVLDAALYAGGIVCAFTGIGLGLSLVMGVAGLNRFAANPLLNLAIAALFIVFALSLFGVLHLALPHSLLERLDQAAGGTRFGRVATALLMGVTFAVTTFTCTAPFVGTLLVSATQGDWRWPAAGLLAFSSVFALPFLVLALIPHALSRLPKSGEWMATTKAALGFIELAAALKFLSNADLVQGWGIFTRQTVLALWFAIGLVATAYLAGIRVQRWRPRLGARWYRIASIGALAATLFVATGFTGARLGELESFLPPAGTNVDGVARRGELAWTVDDLDAGLRAARAQGKLVLIDFTGYTCTNCRWMEANMFPRPDVTRELAQFVRVRLFTDGRGDIYRRQQTLEREKFNTVALPLYAVVDSTGAPRATFLGMTRNPREFTDFLVSARTPLAAR